MRPFASVSFREFLQHPIVESLGWTLLHSLWQGAGVALALWIVLIALRRASASVRYLASCAALLLLLVMPLITLAFLVPRESSAVAERVSNIGEMLTRRMEDTNRPSVVESTISPPIPSVPMGVDQPFPISESTIVENSTANVPSLEESFAVRSKRLLRPWVPRVTMLWCCGVVLLSMRLFVAWFRVERLKNASVQTTSFAKLQMLHSLSERLGVRRVVLLVESSLVEVPTVIGWLKPVILLPIATVNSLSLSQLEAILAHELAHIRRADYVVNLLQSAIETLLFYHPAVWWISSSIRQEREHCCDDLAASISGDKAGYVAALVRMEELRSVPRGVALAARGGNLLVRVRRLLRPPSPDRMSHWWLTGLVTSLIVVCFIGLPLRATSNAEPTLAPESQSKNKKDSAESDNASSSSRGFPRVAQSSPGHQSGKLAIVEGLDNITPAQIADRIEEIWKRYQSIEYTAKIEETRNSSPFGDKPTLVNGTGTTVFRTDGTRWFAEESSFTYQKGTTETTPTRTMSAFDGERHRILNYFGQYVDGEDDLATRRWSPTLLFWESGLAADWLLGALRRPEAELVERVETAETTCLHVRSSWTPEWSDVKQSFDIMICPEQSWLPRRVLIERNGDTAAEWQLSEITTTESGLHYPGEIRSVHPDKDFRPKRNIRITSFRERNDFKPEDFTFPVPQAVDIVDRRAGYAWHNDPWWDELGPWAFKNLQWPQPDLQPLRDLKSHSDPKIQGQPAPPMCNGEQLTSLAIPADFSARRLGDYNLRVLYFFGGMLIDPSPKQIKALDHLYRRYADSGVEFVGIASYSKTPDVPRQAVRELEISFPVYIDKLANAADVRQNKEAAQWGSTYVAYELPVYTGIVVIDFEGKVQFVDPQTPDLSNGMSHLESIIRTELLKKNGTSDPPLLRQQIVNRMSQILRGTPADGKELTAAVIDKSPLWMHSAQQDIVESIPAAERDFFNAHGLTIQSIFPELNESSERIPDAAYLRLEREWKRRAKLAAGIGIIRGTIRSGAAGEFNGCKATLIVEPVFRMLSSNTPGGWILSKDASRMRKIETDDNGSFAIENMPRGSYQITIAATGRPRAERMVHLVSHDSQAEVAVGLWGTDTISGKVTDSAGDIIANAKVKAVKRFESPESVDTGRYTTAHLPTELATSNASGDFVFESLYEVAYVFEVSADGYETATTDVIPVGTSTLLVKLRPIGNAGDEPAAKVQSKTIFGTVVCNGKPVASARVGLQAWTAGNEEAHNRGPFVATAVTGSNGQYRITIPAGLNQKMQAAVWAFAEGFQPSRENEFQTLETIASELQQISLTQTAGCVFQIHDDGGLPIANAGVFVAAQRLPESIPFKIPDNWQNLVSGKTDEAGLVTLSNVISEAMTDVRIAVPGNDATIRVGPNFFLNQKASATAPHFQFTLPVMGAIEGQLEFADGTLPPDLMLEISTVSKFTNSRFEIFGEASAKVDADGHFKVATILPGPVSIKPFLAVDQPLRAEVPRKIAVSAGETAECTIPIQKGVHVRGQIIQSDTRKGHPGVRFTVLYGQSAREQQDMNNQIDITTDADGRFDTWVPSGNIVLRIAWKDQHYSNTEWWSDRIHGLGSVFEIPEVEEFDLEPIEFVPTGTIHGTVTDQNGKPLTNWTIFGYPVIPGKKQDLVMNSLAGTNIDHEGRFEGRFPSTLPPEFWQVSHRDWPTPYDFDDNKWKAEVVTKNPLLLRVDTSPPAPPAPLKTEANSGDPADDKAVTASGLVGTWSLQSMKWNGIDVPKEQCIQTTMTIENHEMTIDKFWSIYFSNVDPETGKAEGGFSGENGLRCSIKVDRSLTPQTIDLTMNGLGAYESDAELEADERALIQSGGVRFPGIFEINGDELRICWTDFAIGTPSVLRIDDFSAGEKSNRSTMVFRRR